MVGTLDVDAALKSLRSESSRWAALYLQRGGGVERRRGGEEAWEDEERRRGRRM